MWDYIEPQRNGRRKALLYSPYPAAFLLQKPKRYRSLVAVWCKYRQLSTVHTPIVFHPSSVCGDGTSLPLLGVCRLHPQLASNTFPLGTLILQLKCLLKVHGHSLYPTSHYVFAIQRCRIVASHKRKALFRDVGEKRLILDQTLVYDPVSDFLGLKSSCQNSPLQRGAICILTCVEELVWISVENNYSH